MKVGLITPPQTNSVLPVIHNAALAAVGLSGWHYELLTTITLPSRIQQLIEDGYVGVNVAAPFKQKVLPLLSRVSMAARGVGAVNTIVFDDRGAEGHNTDSIGFMVDLAAHNVHVHGRRVVVLGAGSAAHAVVLGLANRGAQVVVVARRDDMAWQLRDDVRRGVSRQLHVEVQPWSARFKVASEAVLIVNCTPVGKDGDQMPWPEEVPLPTGAVVYDLNYELPRTRFMDFAIQSGLRAIGGLGMLVHQAAVTFEIWTQHEAPVEIMMQTAKEFAHGKTNAG